jgi:hypothetical protein
MPFVLENLPEFLKIPQDERKAAWEKFRAAHPLHAETKPTYRPITDLPGAAPHDDDDPDA